MSRFWSTSPFRTPAILICLLEMMRRFGPICGSTCSRRAEAIRISKASPTTALPAPLVLKAHHLDQPGTSQIVRVDQGDLAEYLTKHPTIALSMNFSVFLNPISQSSGVAPGPGGYRQQFSQPTEREASPISTPQQVQDVIKPATSGTVSEKIHGLQLLESYIEFLRETQNPKPAARPAGAAQQSGIGSAPPPPDSAVAPPPVVPPNANGVANAAANAKAIQSIIDIFTAAIQSDLRDPSKLVQYWAQYQAARLGDENNRCEHRDGIAAGRGLGTARSRSAACFDAAIESDTRAGQHRGERFG